MKEKVKINNSYEDSECLSTSLSSESYTNEENKVNLNNQSLDLPMILNFNNLQHTTTSNFASSSKIRCNNAEEHGELEKTFNIFQNFPIINKILESENQLISKSPKQNFIKDKTPSIIGELIVENSCNAVDHKLSDSIEFNSNKENLSFNGRIENLCNDENNQLMEDTSILMYTNEKSPDLFEEDDEEIILPSTSFNSDILNKSENKQNDSTTSEIDENFKDEEILLKRLQMSLTGVLPPPSVTLSQMNVSKMIELYKENEKLKTIYEEEELKNVSNDDCVNNNTKVKFNSLLVPTHSPDELLKMEWPEILSVKSHGIYYNRSKYNEKFETLSLKYIERYIGAETSSSFTISMSPTSAKKRSMRLKLLGKSPGNRLSHLAKRRAIFSSENLAGHSSKSSKVNFAKRQILLDPKRITKTGRKTVTPKRRTPSRRRTPKRKKTPSSRNKNETKHLFNDSLTSRESSKRALFQSPAKINKPILNIPQIKPEIANRVQKSKRVLFTPEKLPRSHSFTCNENENKDMKLQSRSRFNSSNCLTELTENKLNENITGSHLTNSLKRKREYENEENDIFEPTNRNTPNSLKFAKSQSFCVNIENQDMLNITNISNRSLIYRSTSEIIPSTSSSQLQLSDHHRKKLLWAVSHALQAKQINVQNPNFKQFAAVLAKVTKRLYLQYEQNQPGSTSEKMMKLTNRLVFYVIQGKSVDEIYEIENENIMNHKNKLEKQNSFLTNDKNLNLKLE